MHRRYRSALGDTALDAASVAEQQAMAGITDAMSRLWKIPNLKLLPTTVAQGIYKNVGGIVQQALSDGAAFLDSTPAYLGLDPTSMNSFLYSAQRGFEQNMVPYQAAIRSGVIDYKSGITYTDMGDTQFLVHARTTLSDAWKVYAAIIDQRAALSWVWSIPGISYIFQFLIGLNTVLNGLEAGLEALVKLPGQVVDWANKVITYAFYGAAGYLGYRLFLAPDAPFKLGKKEHA